jgi:PIN domain nuclease of toxin-antitoxin system
VEAVIYLDTHVLAWLYAGERRRFSRRAEKAIAAAADLRVSPMVRLELQYLYEIDRLGAPASPVLDELAARLGIVVCDAPFPAVAQAAESLSWTRDPFDRLIVAQAALHEAPLVTRDETIHAHYPHALWE